MRQQTWPLNRRKMYKKRWHKVFWQKEDSPHAERQIILKRFNLQRLDPCHFLFPPSHFQKKWHFIVILSFFVISFMPLTLIFLKEAYRPLFLDFLFLSLLSEHFINIHALSLKGRSKYSIFYDIQRRFSFIISRKVSIHCVPGYNGGLDQKFTAELYTRCFISSKNKIRSTKLNPKNWNWYGLSLEK